MKKLPLVVIGLALVLAGCTKSPSGPGGTPAADLQQYDGKVLRVTSVDGKVKGSIGIKLDSTASRPSLDVFYNLIINDRYPKNKGELGFDYQYAGDLVEADSIGDAEGTVSAAYCNKDVIPTDAFSTDFRYNDNCPAFNAGGDTSTFTWQFSQSMENYEEVLAATTIDIYDSSKAWEKDPDDTSSSTNNDDLAVSQGNKVASYTLVITE